MIVIDLDMKAVFQDHLKELPIFLFPDGAVVPKTVAGNPILACDVAGHVKVYLDLLNSNESLSPQSVFQVLIHIFGYLMISVYTHK